MKIRPVGATFFAWGQERPLGRWG